MLLTENATVIAYLYQTNMLHRFQLNDQKQVFLFHL